MEPRRIGLIVPSSNTTMETEVPEMLRRRAERAPESFTVHSSRVRMRSVTAGELDLMVQGSDRCAVELADAEVDVIAYACLVAIMAQGRGYHEQAERRLAEVAAAAGCTAPVVSSAGALVRSLHAVGAERVSLIAPYMRELTDLVIQYIEDAGIEVVDHACLEIPRNVDVARHDPERLIPLVRELDTRHADAVVLSACVQMPSLSVLGQAQALFDCPVVSASAATVYEVLQRLGLSPEVPHAGDLLAGTTTLSAS
jgi:maleate isomerase